MERTKFLHFPLTPMGSGPHRREEHSLALVELNGVTRLPSKMVLHSSIVTDFALEKTVPKVASVSK